MEDPMIN
jgi:hypothetical protein